MPSPFPPENLAVFIADRVSTYYRHRDRTRAEIARLALSFVRPQAGNYLLFFPSYVYLRMVHEEFRTHAPEIDVIVQEPGRGERGREAFLTRFDADNPRTLVGFAVMGGVFGEGIDPVADRLSGAGIVQCMTAQLHLPIPTHGSLNDFARLAFAYRQPFGLLMAVLPHVIIVSEIGDLSQGKRKVEEPTLVPKLRLGNASAVSEAWQGK